MAERIFFFGDWQVSPVANTLQQGRKKRQLEPKAMDVLCYLCEQAGEVVSSEQLLEHCWAGVDTGDNPLHKTIAQLRRALDDSATAPTYIETIRKRGYRTLAEVRFPIGSEQAVSDTPTWQGESPFPGLRAYSADDAEVFFGRSEQIQLLLERIGQQAKYGRDFCLVLGPSGSGKSSLINAGIIPNLLTDQGAYGVRLLSHAALDLADVNGDTLWLALASAMLDWELDDLPVLEGESADTLAYKLQQNLTAVLSRLAAHTQAQRDKHYRFGLFIDRLEVLLSSPAFDDEQRQHWIDLLEQLATSGTVLLLSACRNEFYPQLVSYPSLRAGKGRGAHFDLAPPSRQELLQMIRLPAAAAGLNWQTDDSTATPLDEILCSEAANYPDALPMLQYMLQQLYLSRDAQGTMLVSVYHELGGLEGAIGVTAEDAIATLSDAEQQAVPRVLSLLVTLREDEQSVTSRSASWQQLQSDSERALVEAMVERRLFVSQLHQGEPSFHIAHEALLRRWPRASEWIEQHKEMLAQQARLFHSASRWQAEQQASAYLLQEGKPLQDAKQLADNPLIALDDTEHRFINASVQRAKRRSWLRRGIVASLATLTLISVLMTARSIDAEQQATARRLDAENLLGFMVGDFADKLRNIGRMDLLDGISNKALEYFTAKGNIQDKTLGFEGRFQHGQTLEAIGEVAYSRGKNDEAKSALLAAEKEFLPLLKEQPENLELLKSLGANAFWQGQMFYDQADWDNTATFFEQYLSYSQKMVDMAPEDKDAQKELASSLNNLGSIQLKLKNFAQAKVLFEQALQQKEALLKASPDDEALVGDVINARSFVASALVAEGQTKDAIKIWESIKREFDKPKYSNNSYIQERLYSSLKFLGEYYFYSKNDDALNVFIIAEGKVDRAVSQDPDNSSWKEDYIILESNILYLKFVYLKENDDVRLEKLKAITEDLGRDEYSSNIIVFRVYDFLLKGDSEAAFLESEKFNDAYISGNYDVSDFDMLKFIYGYNEIGNDKISYSCTDINKKLEKIGVSKNDQSYVFFKNGFEKCFN
ncbi:winged helix-turn-helix domain-containing protein [Shewanella sp. C32]|uniref:Winged helix-turn-helix domain-containing protein n=1 Tax=Shewanella electrica TaxID=515560 RepID=A0ABT2FMN6_9GAMM|nr:winged helix-turn-helix domain-containing protein [Shewanella electrica]MCH1926237.1 winged helix-turn-helix domain-containing protein [Shewanella electrica]MCS4557598.1 winged helix-turn-helix domain-containing protein [Shewanella electrica]